MATEIELLQKIAENSASSSPLNVALVAGISAIAGALASAILSYLGIAKTVNFQTQIERQKLQAAVVTAERLRWLQELRLKVSTFYAQIEMQISHLERPVGADAQKYQEMLDAFSLQVATQCYAIFLMLDKEKTEQAALYEALDGSLSFVRMLFSQKGHASLPVDKEPFAELKRVAFDALEGIGRKAWKKVQSLQ